MPPKGQSARDLAIKKQDIATKVREIKERQQKWMEEKRKTSESSTHDSVEDDQLPSLSSQSNHVERWLENQSSPAHSQTSYQPRNYETPPPPQSSEDFNLVGDRIIDRVKNNLGISRNSNSERLASYTASPSKYEVLPSHLCQRCQRLMVSPHHSPMMLIPCGHNLCEACCRGAATCYACDSEITGQTGNIVLQQIIATKSTRTPDVKDGQMPVTHTDKGNKQEIQTLLLRREAMEEERYNVEQNITDMNEKIMGEVEQISSIEKKEGDIIHEISRLQSKLVALQHHKDEFRVKITSHQSNIGVERKKMTMIDETVQYLSSRLTTLNHTT